MTLSRPDFRLDQPNPNPANITDAEWWLWLRLKELEPRTQLGGILAWKKGFHSTGQYNLEHYPDNYSVRDAVNRSGSWWRDKASALDWTFPDAQGGTYTTIAKYTARVIASGRDSKDPRLDLILYEVYGNADSDRTVEGWDEYHETSVTSDSSHLWHIHFSFFRSKCGDFWGMWALLTVLMGWSVSQWRATLPSTPVDPSPTPSKPAPSPDDWTTAVINTLPTLRQGATGVHVRTVQALCLARGVALTVDGDFGPKTATGVKAVQRKYGAESVDGVVGPETWTIMITGKDSR